MQKTIPFPRRHWQKHAYRWAIWTGSHFDPGSSTWHWPGNIWFGDDRGWTVCDHSCNLIDSLATKSPWESFFCSSSSIRLIKNSEKQLLEFEWNCHFSKPSLLFCWNVISNSHISTELRPPFFFDGWKSFVKGRRAAGKWRVDCAGCEARMGRCDVMMSCVSFFIPCYHHPR